MLESFFQIINNLGLFLLLFGNRRTPEPRYLCKQLGKMMLLSAAFFLHIELLVSCKYKADKLAGNMVYSAVPNKEEMV